MTTSGSLRRRHWIVAAALFAGFLTLYLYNRRVTPFEQVRDTMPGRLVPFSILRYGTVTLEPFRQSLPGPRFGILEKRGTLVAYHPIGSSIVSLPFFLPWYVKLLVTGNATAEGMVSASAFAEKFTAAAMTAMAVVVIWIVLLRRGLGVVRATLTATFLGGCTLLWAVASQQNWQMTSGAFLMSLILLTSESRRPVAMAFPLGLLFGLWFAVRPMSILFAVAAAVGLLLAVRHEPPRTRGRVILLYGLGAALFAIPNQLYTWHYFGSVLGGYGHARQLFSHPWKVIEGANGLLVSANRGLFTLMPLTILGVIGAWRALKRAGREPILAAMVVGAFAYFVLHAWSITWAGGWSFGPRYLIEILPLLAVTSGLAVPRRTPAVIIFVSLAALYSAWVQFSGANCFPLSNWSGRMGADLEASAWDWRHFQPLEEFRAWRQGAPDPFAPPQ